MSFQCQSVPPEPGDCIRNGMNRKFIINVKIGAVADNLYFHLYIWRNNIEKLNMIPAVYDTGIQRITTLNVVITHKLPDVTTQKDDSNQLKYYLFSVAIWAPDDGYQICVVWKENL